MKEAKAKQRVNSGAVEPEQFQPHRLRPVGPWASYLTFLSYNFLTSKIGMVITHTSWGYEEKMRQWYL